MADELSPTPSPEPLEPMNGAEVADQILTSPDPEAQSGPDPDPDASPGSMSGIVTFSPAAIRGFVERGFLTVQDPSFDDVARANFKMLTAAWKAGIRAEAPAPSPPAADAEADESRRRFLQKMARVQA